MSAYVINSDNYDAIFTFLTKRRSQGLFSIRVSSPGYIVEIATDNEVGIEEIVNVLIAQNVASVNFRYKENGENVLEILEQFANTFEINEVIAEHYKFKRYDHDLTAVQVLKILDCYEYQASETPGYRETEAAKIIQQIRLEVITCLPGYSDASWGL